MLWRYSVFLIAGSLTLSSIFAFAKAGSGQAAQSTPGRSGEPDFAEASIRPSMSKEYGFRLRTSPGRLAVTGITAEELVEYAFHLKPFRVRGGGGWVKSEKFDISAVTDESVSALQSKESWQKQDEQIRRMTQALLRTRFGLITHKEESPGFVYELTVAKPMKAANHPGLAPSSSGSSPQGNRTASTGNFNVNMTNVPLSLLALRISDYVESTVTDNTGLAGLFDVTMSWSETPSENASALDGTDTLSGALREQLDLKLTRSKAPVEILVIDTLDHPSAN